MDINAINTHSSMNPYMAQNSRMQGPPPPPPQGGMSGMQSGTQVGISGAGRMMGMDSSSRSEMKDFHDTVKAVMESGEFDAEALAEEAPQALKNMAEAQGTDVASILEGLPARMESMGPADGMQRMMGGQPPMGGMQMGGMGGPSEAMDSFIDTLLEASESDDTDLSSLAEIAPEEVEAMAAELGVSVEDLVSDMLSRAEENGDPREQGRPPQTPNQQGLEAYAAQMGGDSMRGFMDALFAS